MLETAQLWQVEPIDFYHAWGVGGHGGAAIDGISIESFPVLAPHYAAMIAKENSRALIPASNHYIYQALQSNAFLKSGFDVNFSGI